MLSQKELLLIPSTELLIAIATPQNVRRETPDGRVFTGKGPNRAVTPRDIRE